ncbi:OLC1v1006829C1 [Oldenlandia corymbosa var. corymbosa]|uniref:OLC1v1006829C1 n=1 Tax=Oldenlandia corymbosa var. corymbosa TaxID=529605 RepID=A0AAV1DHX8_OLDCO|nr:OLC1v1006829C1 [Oldenlandia corymbosa var. corymbosa]
MASRKRSFPNDADMHGLYKELDEASCAICMDHPHNAVLLLCSSHDKGCRSFICDTSYRHSNCLDRFRKLKDENISPSLTLVDQNDMVNASSLNVMSSGDQNEAGDSDSSVEGVRLGVNSTDISLESLSNLRCPLCRGSVFGWKVVDEARRYLDLKSRCCSRESCSFVGNYRELRRHARRVHPTARPADVDPMRQRAWRRLEDQREYDDIVTAIRSAMPGAVVLGDYVIENGDRFSSERDRGSGDNSSRFLSTFFWFQMVGSAGSGSEQRGGRSRPLSRYRRSNEAFSRRRFLWGENLLGLQDEEDDDEDNDDEGRENEAELNVLSDIGEEHSFNSRRRQRRRLTRSRADHDRQ